MSAHTAHHLCSTCQQHLCHRSSCNWCLHTFSNPSVNLSSCCTKTTGRWKTKPPSNTRAKQTHKTTTERCNRQWATGEDLFLIPKFSGKETARESMWYLCTQHSVFLALRVTRKMLMKCTHAGISGRTRELQEGDIPFPKQVWDHWQSSRTCWTQGNHSRPWAYQEESILPSWISEVQNYTISSPAQLVFSTGLSQISQTHE